MKRKQITFFASYYEAAHELPDADRLALYDAILQLAFDGKEPRPASPVVRAVWAAIRPNVQNTINKSNAGMVHRPIGNQNARKYPIVESVGYEEINPSKNEQKTNTIQTENEQKTNNKDMDKEKDMDKDKGKELENSLSITSNEVCQIWNEICAGAGLQRVMKMTTKRQEKVRCRVREWQKGGQDAAATFREVCTIISQSSFCKGQNNHKWQATFDWIIENDTNCIKVLEGKYNDNNTNDYGSRHLNERAAENEFWRDQHNAARAILGGVGNH